MWDALAKRRSAAIFFDFKAAFPSVSRELMLRTLQKLRLPGWAMLAGRHLYSRTSCLRTGAGANGEPFQQGAGIRHGCPLSPLAFVATLEPSLNYLERVTLKSAPLEG